MTSFQFELGDLVWAKLPGYPFWPARLAKTTEVSKEVCSAKRSTKPLLVFFFGTQDYAWMRATQITAWESDYKKKSSTKSKKFVHALDAAIEYRRRYKNKEYQFTIHPDHLDSEGNLIVESNDGDQMDTIDDNNEEEEEEQEEEQGEQDGFKGTGISLNDSDDDGNKDNNNNNSTSTGKSLKDYTNNKAIKQAQEYRRKRRLKVMRRLGLCAPAPL